jgi:hypothetical protein
MGKSSRRKVGGGGGSFSPLSYSDAVGYHVDQVLDELSAGMVAKVWFDHQQAGYRFQSSTPFTRCHRPGTLALRIGVSDGNMPWAHTSS